MAQLGERPHPPGDYPAVVVGTGPGGTQLSYELDRLGIRHALISEDEAPAGMFRRWPLFQRLITATKPYAAAEPGSRAYERYDWNSLVAVETEHQALVRRSMDGTSDYPARAEMERGIVAFAERTGVRARFGCRWTATRRVGQRFVLETSDGEYRSGVAIFATGLVAPYRPAVPGIDDVPHYSDMKPVSAYRDRRVFIVGKRNSGFELAEGLLPYARQIVLASPSPTRLALVAGTTAAVRARYAVPFEDHALRGGGVFVLDATIERIVRRGEGYDVIVRMTGGGTDLRIATDEVIAATGFMADLRDLPALGVATFTHLRLPAQTNHWESATVPGVYFAGALTQGALGLRKYGLASASAGLHGYRYNARVLARHLAAAHFGVRTPRTPLREEEVVGRLLGEAARAPELWHQRSYLCRVVTFDDGTAYDEGVQPLAQFLEDGAPSAIAIVVETNAKGETYPAVYTRVGGDVVEHLLPSHPLLDYETRDHEREMASIVEGLRKRAA